MHRIYFLRTGNHTDSSGEKESYSAQDLKEIKDSYNKSLFQAPVVIGHEEDIKKLYQNDRAPAYGWVDRLGLDSQGLYADVKLAKEFEELIEREVPPYKYVSAAIYERDNPFNPTKGNKQYLRHIAFLGGQPPAIKNLPEVFKLYSESSLQNTKELFNNIKILKLDETDKNMPIKKYMVEDLDTYEEVVSLPNPETATLEEIQSFLEENAFDFLVYILTEGEYGYPGEITGFEEMPSKENNYLFNPETNSFSGIFYDETSSETDGYSFEIKKSGANWSSSYIPVNQEEAEDNFAEEAPVEEAPVEEAELAPPVVEEEVAELTTEDEQSLASGSIPGVEVEEPAVESGGDTLAAELELMRSESRNLRNEVLKLKNELNEMKMNEYRAYSEKFNPIISGTSIKSDELASLLFEIDTISNTRKLTKAYSEVTKEKPIDLLKKLLDEALQKTKTAGMVTYGEMCEDEEEEKEEKLENPVGAVYSEEGIDMHKRVLDYCSKNNLDPKNISQYLEAYKAVCK